MNSLRGALEEATSAIRNDVDAATLNKLRVTFLSGMYTALKMQLDGHEFEDLFKEAVELCKQVEAEIGLLPHVQ